MAQTRKYKLCVSYGLPHCLQFPHGFPEVPSADESRLAQVVHVKCGSSVNPSAPGLQKITTKITETLRSRSVDTLYR